MMYWQIFCFFSYQDESICVQESTMIHVHCQSNVYYCTIINYDTCTLSKYCVLLYKNQLWYMYIVKVMCITVQESTMIHVHCQSIVYYCTIISYDTCTLSKYCVLLYKNQLWYMYTFKVMCITVQESTIIHVHCQSNVYYFTRINYHTCTLSK
jgi:hypothetical protein